jgi:hypothetical protein
MVGAIDHVCRVAPLVRGLKVRVGAFLGRWYRQETHLEQRETTGNLVKEERGVPFRNGRTFQRGAAGFMALRAGAGERGSELSPRAFRHGSEIAWLLESVSWRKAPAAGAGNSLSTEFDGADRGRGIRLIQRLLREFQ